MWQPLRPMWLDPQDRPVSAVIRETLGPRRNSDACIPLPRLSVPVVQTSMGEDVVFLKAGEVEPGADRQEGKCTGSECGAPFPDQHGVELGFDCVQMKDVVGGIAQLTFRELSGAPVATLLLL